MLEISPWVQPVGLERALLKELIAVARLCYERGWACGSSGNFSLQLRPGLVWQSPSGMNKGALSIESFIAVALSSAEPLAPESAKPSEEMPVHLGIYEHCPAARAVVHAHSPALVRLSALLATGEAAAGEAALCFKGQELQKALGSSSFDEELTLRVTTNRSKEGMGLLRASMGELLNRQAQVLILAGHGVYAWGASPLEALHKVEALEFLCQSRF